MQYLNFRTNLKNASNDLKSHVYISNAANGLDNIDFYSITGG